MNPAFLPPPARPPLVRSLAFDRPPLQRQLSAVDFSAGASMLLVALKEPLPDRASAHPLPLWPDFAHFLKALEAPGVRGLLGADALGPAQLEAAYNVYRVTRESDGLALVVLGRLARSANSSVCEPVPAGLDESVFSNFGRTPVARIHADAGPTNPEPAYPDTRATLHMGSNEQWSLLGNVCFLLAVMQAGRPVFTASGTEPASLLHPVRGLSVLALEYALLMAGGYQYVRATGADGQPWCEGFRCCDSRFRVAPTLASCTEAIAQARADPQAFVQRVRDFTAPPETPHAGPQSP